MSHQKIPILLNCIAAFLGAAACQREAIGVPMPTKDRRALDTVSARLLAKVGADELERAWQRGTDMSVADLLRQAPAFETAEGERDGPGQLSGT